jgi:hypothetical protein
MGQGDDKTCITRNTDIFADKPVGLKLEGLGNKPWLRRISSSKRAWQFGSPHKKQVPFEAITGKGAYGQPMWRRPLNGLKGHRKTRPRSIQQIELKVCRQTRVTWVYPIGMP